MFGRNRLRENCVISRFYGVAGNQASGYGELCLLAYTSASIVPPSRFVCRIHRMQDHRGRFDQLKHFPVGSVETGQNSLGSFETGV